MGELKRIGRNVSRPFRQVSSQASRFASQAAAQARRTAQQAQAQARRAAEQVKAQAQRAARQAEENARRTVRQTAEQAGRAVSQAKSNVGGIGRAGQSVVRQTNSNLKGLDRNFTRPVLAPVASVALPVAAAYFGGPLGLAAGLQASSRLPGLKKGWQKAGDTVGLDKNAMSDLANYGSIASGAYGLGSLASGGSLNSWSFGGPGSGLLGKGGFMGSGLGASNVAPGTQFGLYEAPAGGYGAEVGAKAVGSGASWGPTASLPTTTLSPGTTSHGWGWLAGSKSAAPYSIKAGGGALGGGSGLFGSGLTLGGLGKAAGIGGLGYLGYNLLKPQDKVPQMQAMPIPEEPLPFTMPEEGYIDYGMAMPYEGNVAGIAGDLQGLGQAQIADYNAQFRPLLAQYSGIASRGYDGDYYANQASADVAGQFAQVQDEQRRGLSRYGLNPNSPAFQSQVYDLAMAQAAAEAGTRTDARQWAADASRQALSQGVQFGQGLFSSGMGALGNAANAYNGLNSDNMQIAGANANTAASAYQNAYQAQADYQNQLYQLQLQNQQNAYQNQMNQFSANQSNNNALLGLAGTLTGAWLFG